MADYARRLGIDHYPFIQKLFQNPAYTDFWAGQAVDKWMAARPLTVPTLIEVGQWDQEDSYGGPAVYKALKDKYEGTDLLHLAIGPWRHSGANHYGYDLGALTFTGDTAQEWRTAIREAVLRSLSQGRPDPHTPPVLTYATGINRWEESPRWPMGTLTPLYLTPGMGASFARPEAAGHDDYVSDPAKPVPFIPRPISSADQTSGSRGWCTTSASFPTGPMSSFIPARSSPNRCTSWARRKSTCSPPPAAATATGS